MFTFVEFLQSVESPTPKARRAQDWTSRSSANDAADDGGLASEEVGVHQSA